MRRDRAWHEPQDPFYLPASQRPRWHQREIPPFDRENFFPARQAPSPRRPHDPTNAQDLGCEMTEPNKVRWGILGCGDVFERESGLSFRTAPHSELAGVMRRSDGLAEDFAKRFAVPHLITNFDDLS